MPGARSGARGCRRGGAGWCTVGELAARLNEPHRGVHHALTVIGTVGKAGPNLLEIGGKKEPLLARGWEHFRGSHSG